MSVICFMLSNYNLWLLLYAVHVEYFTHAGTYACYLMYRGPPSGNRGEVVLLFEDNPLSKVGVRFDKPIPDGVDLGGLCKGNGFFCNGMNSHSLAVSYLYLVASLSL